MVAPLWQQWLGEVGPAYNIENLVRIFVGGDVLLPLMPPTQRNGQFLRHGALTVLLGLLWLDPLDREAFVSALSKGGRRFTTMHQRQQQSDFAGHMGHLDFEAFFIAEGSI